MEFCAYCWIKNVEVGDWYGGGINIEYSVRSELNTVYVHHCWDSVNNGGEYPIALDERLDRNPHHEQHHQLRREGNGRQGRRRGFGRLL